MQKPQGIHCKIPHQKAAVSSVKGGSGSLFFSDCVDFPDGILYTKKIRLFYFWGKYYRGKQKKKEKKKIYTENKIGRYVQFLIEREDFLELVASWLLSIEDERMQLLRQFIFEVELSETEELKNVLYQYGSYLTEKNYLERKFFEYMAELVRKMEQNRRAAALPAAIE